MSCCVSNEFSDRKMTYQIELVLFVNIGILSQKRRTLQPPQRTSRRSKAAGETGQVCCELHRVEPLMATGPLTPQRLRFEVAYATSDPWCIAHNGSVGETCYVRYLLHRYKVIESPSNLLHAVGINYDDESHTKTLTNYLIAGRNLRNFVTEG